MRKWSWIFTLATLVALPAFAQSTFPDLRGTWTGQSESIVSGKGDLHRGDMASSSPSSPSRYSSVPFTFVIDKQDGRRFSGTFSSPQQTESVIGVISKTGEVYFVDSDGYALAHLLAPNQLESCYLQLSGTGRVASCTEFTKQGE